MAAECQQCLEYQALIEALQAEQPTVGAWLCRDPTTGGEQPSYYILSAGEPKPARVDFPKGKAPWFWARTGAHEIEPGLWEKAGGMYLAPAGGPVRVEVGIRCL